MPTIYRVTTLLILTICLSSLLVSAQDPGDAASGTSNSTTSPSHGDNAAGAAGSNSGALNLSRGGMIAIILVAVIVGGGGSTSKLSSFICPDEAQQLTLHRHSRIRHSLLHCQETSMGDSKEFTTICSSSDRLRRGEERSSEYSKYDDDSKTDGHIDQDSIRPRR